MANAAEVTDLHYISQVKRGLGIEAIVFLLEKKLHY